MEKILSLCDTALQKQTFISGIWSNPRTKQDTYTKCTMSPIHLKGIDYVQFTFYKDNKAYHHNIPYDACGSFILTNCTYFKQFQLFTSEQDYAVLINKKALPTSKN